MKSIKIFKLTFIAFCISGCTSSISSFTSVKDEGEKNIEEASQYSIKKTELPHVRYSADFYVPELKNSEQSMPAWFFEQSRPANYLDYTLEEVMRDELTRRGINVRYLDSLDKDKRFSLSHIGTFGELLDKISFATKYSYKIAGDLLSWSKFTTAELDVSFIAGETNYLFGNKENAGSEPQNSSGASSAIVTDTGFSNSEEYISFSTENLSIWNDLKSSIELLKSPEGKFVINQATSTIMIKDYPDNVDAIKDYISGENKKLTKMVAVDMQIIEFTSEEGDQRGINWNVIKQDLATGGVFGLKSAFNTLLKDDLAPTILGYSQSTGKYAGSQVLINVLDKYGAVSNIKKRKVVSLNNQVAKLIEGGEIGYLAQSGSSSTANVGTQDTLMPGLLKTGDAVFMLPNAVGDKIVIQLSTKITRFGKIRTVESGGKSIETPETTKSDLFLKFAVNDGETLLISGSSDDKKEYTENSTGGLVLLGGELGGNKSSRETIILITPRIISR